MRILYLNEHPVWNYGLPWGFSHLGHEVKIVPVIQKNSLAATMRTFKPDVMITVGWLYEYMKPKSLEIIRDMAREFSCLHAYWATEDITWHQRWSQRMVQATRPDAVFTINADCIPNYARMGIPGFHLEFGYNPAYIPGVNEPALAAPVFDLVLVANSYNVWVYPDSFRNKSVEMLIRPLAEKGYNLALYGQGWQNAPWAREKPHPNVRYLGPLQFADTFQVYRNTRINLNLQNQGEHTTQITSRTFEIMGCGGFQLTARTPAVERLFAHRRHLVMSGSPEETLELADYYLAHDDKRQEIAEAGQAEVLAKHTYDQRAEYFLSCLESIKKKTSSVPATLYYFNPDNTIPLKLKPKKKGAVKKRIIAPLPVPDDDLYIDDPQPQRLKKKYKKKKKK